MRTSSNIAASPSQNGPESRAVPSSRQSPPPPLVTGTALNHDEISYGLRKTRRKPVHYTSTLEENSERRQKFQNFVEKIVTDGKYAIFHAAQLLHQRLYLFNFESQFCRDKY
uniref:Uncharacterized protein n=1 Tax=Caenorhabditis japonica TaxID=281687 RepID=A0A8R1ILX5_CAEJA